MGAKRGPILTLAVRLKIMTNNFVYFAVGALIVSIVLIILKLTGAPSISWWLIGLLTVPAVFIAVTFLYVMSIFWRK